MTDILTETAEANAAVEKFLHSGDAPAAPVLESPEPGFFRLPGGFTRGGAGADVVYEAEVRELTGADEEYLDRVKRGKPEKFMDALIERGLVSIGDAPASKDNIGLLLTGDGEKVLLEIRRATYGDTLEWDELTCPHCGERFALTLSIDDIPMTTLAKSEDRNFDVTLRRGGVAHCHLPRMADLPTLPADATDAEASTAMLANVIDTIEERGNVTFVAGAADAVRSLGLADRKAILTELSKRRIGPDLQAVSFTHDVCQKEVPFPLTAGDLFPGL
ncbi:hypothetical protein [Terracoccus sp. 273MFTsu3.1]|uniref:T4 family baseplate hub assembly chaperone n=1 Tax=Terracoccus sp. 273MFTsu3.1 TaxID=1172188 RepID=UPI00036BFA8E|nr:hypothetical protein [Terracoccus sp. 273MFTsu3.1]